MSTVPAAPPGVTYQNVLGYRSRTLTLNPNPITDHNLTLTLTVIKNKTTPNEIEHRVIISKKKLIS